ncbi:MAG: hypothetical protein ACM3QZ_03135 [Solirubrobacterales bacterium]
MDSQALSSVVSMGPGVTLLGVGVKKIGFAVRNFYRGDGAARMPRQGVSGMEACTHGPPDSHGKADF